jgi:hypothetical protein
MFSSDLKNEILTQSSFECLYIRPEIQQGVALCHGKAQVSVATAVVYIQPTYLLIRILLKKTLQP